jgi:hypothetical protein
MREPVTTTSEPFASAAESDVDATLLSTPDFAQETTNKTAKTRLVER